MATAAQITANRANAQKSTGPASEAGRQKSSRNSLRHGLFASSVLPLDPKSQELLHQLSESFIQGFQPATSLEYSLVQTMVTLHWNRLRIWGLENALFSTENVGTLANRVVDTQLSALSRFDSRYRRQFHSTLQELVQLRQIRQNGSSFDAQPSLTLLEKWENEPNSTFENTFKNEETKPIRETT